jgi:hypothetical protein
LRFDSETAHRLASGRISVVIRPLSQPPPTKPEQAILSRRRPNEAIDLEYLWKREWVTQEHGHARLESTQKRLDEVTLSEARAAGHGSLLAFKEWFVTTIGKWRDDREIYVIRFQLIEQPRYVNALADTSPRFDQVHDYTTSPSKSIERDVEAVPEGWQERFSAESELERDQRRARETLDRQLMSTEARMQRARATARRHGIDVTRQETRLLEALKKHDRGRALATIEAMERKVQSRAA